LVFKIQPQERTKNALVITAVVAGILSLIIPVRLIQDKVSEMARERIAGPPPRPLSAEWAAVVEELKVFVENERGLKFKNKVPVEVESPQEFQDRLADEASEYGEFDASESYITLKALNLVERNFDADSSDDPLQDGGTLGYYDSYANRLVVQAEAPSPFARSIVVHELTHALQDQHFNLDREMDWYDESLLAFDSLVEGDATRIEQLYLTSLSPEEQEAAAAEQANAGGSGPPASPSLQVLAMLSGFPYEVGEQFVADVFAAGGQARLDEAFKSPPTTTEQLLHPERFLTLEKPVEVESPEPEGEVYEEGVWGEAGLLTMLLNTIPEEQAWAAADGWAGDYYVAWKRGGQDCVRMSIATDGASDKQELLVALRSWAIQHPAVSIREGRNINIRACVA
jgi:hypothetical protein